MTSDYQTYLAANILNEDRVVTYRLLSRALKVHVNAAKEMLFEFHRQQNGKKPGTVHATYIVAGNKNKAERAVDEITKDDEGDIIQSSPFQSSPAAVQEDIVEHTPVLSVILVREEDLQELRSQYDTITSLHIYSLGPSLLKDLQVLSDSAREIYNMDLGDDLFEHASDYGTILNKGVRRRTGFGPPPLAGATSAIVPVKPDPLKSTSATTKEGQKPPQSLMKENEIISSSQLGKSSQSSTAKDFFAKGSAGKKAPNNPPVTKRDNSSIFKSFAKATPKLTREGTGSSAAVSGEESAPPSGAEDEVMKDMSEDEEDNYTPLAQSAFKERVDADIKSRKDREAALRKMMEEEEPPEESTPDAIDADNLDTTEALQDKECLDEVQVSGGRKRGRRRVLKKKTVKDEEGYLVTKEEPAWESFSEDEVVPPKPKAVSSASSSAAKPRKGAGKPGQGNIMSFFGKK